MERILQSFWYGAGTATELALLNDRGAAGDRVRVVGRTAKGALFGYELDSADGGEPTSEAILRFLTVGDAAAWMRRQGFPPESIEGAFPTCSRRPEPAAPAERRRTASSFGSRPRKRRRAGG